MGTHIPHWEGKGFYKGKSETFKGFEFIEDPKELGKIIDWAKQQEREQTVTVCARSPPEPVLIVGIIPQNEVYTEQDNTSKSLLIG
jgi:hypothetical protein